MFVKQKINIFEKICDILVMLVDFCKKFSMILADFCYPDPDPFHWSGSEIKRIRIRNTKELEIYSEIDLLPVMDLFRLNRTEAVT